MLPQMTYQSFFEVGCRRYAKLLGVQPCFIAAQCGRIMQAKNTPAHKALRQLLWVTDDIADEVIRGKEG